MKPETVFRIGLVSASVFVNESESGKRRTRSVKLQRRYKDGDEWKSTSSFSLAELPQAKAVLDLAMKFVAEKEASIRGD